MFHRVKSERQPHEEEQNTVKDSATEEEASYEESSEEDEAEEAEFESQDDEAQEEETQSASSSNLDIPSTPPYQRGLQTAGRPGAPLTGGTSYGASNIPAAGPSVTSAASSESKSEAGSRLTIGRGITMSGEIEACDYLLVEGTVEAALKGAKALDIAESGTFYGTVEIDNATVAGRFEGDLTVSGRLTVKASGVITGTIAYSELAVEAGAVIEGALTPMSAESLSGSHGPSRSQNEGSSKGKKGKRPQPANSDNGLFRATAAAE